MPGAVNSMEAITVTVRGANGNMQQSTGEVLFTYRVGMKLCRISCA